MQNKLKHIIILFIIATLSYARAFAADVPKSHLAEGIWAKISVNNNGIYKITYNDLLKNKLISGAVSSNSIGLFGYGGGMLSELNSNNTLNDLNEINIMMFDGGDGIFNDGDYLLFYGESPIKWTYNSNNNIFIHQANYYTDYTYYFITASLQNSNRKRIDNAAIPQEIPTKTITTFPDYVCHELELTNIAKMGKEWFGEEFNYSTRAKSLSLNFPDYIASENTTLFVRYISQGISSLSLSGSGLSGTLSINENPLSSEYAKETTKKFSFNLTTSTARFDLNFSANSNATKAYIDYMEFNYRRQLKLYNNMLIFRTVENIGNSNITEFKIANATSSTIVWDISNPLQPQNIQGTLSGSDYIFKCLTDTLKEFAACNNNYFLSPIAWTSIKNQNLHGESPVDYIIVTHPLFLDQAGELAKFHRQRNNYNILITTPEQIYNEFSSGAQDPIAIRRLVKMFYDRALSSNLANMPKYLLLMGDCSYDYKNKTSGNTNFVPIYQTTNSISELSLSTDDMYGFLDDNESGWGTADSLDIGIGRFTVSTAEQAQNAVTKSIIYGDRKNQLLDPASKTISNFGDWRNSVTFVADDGENFDKSNYSVAYESNGYFTDFITKNTPTINIDKIYLDAYPQATVPSGARYPDAKNAIDQRINKGTLILNYEGHSGATDWSDEKVVTIESVNKWNNKYNLAFIIAASCSYARIDEPNMVPGASLAFRNTSGGAIAIVAATRVAYTYPNNVFHDAMLKTALTKNNGKIATFGDIIKNAKNNIGNMYALKPFVLIGDPALNIALPEFNVATTAINGKSVTTTIDTIKALSETMIEGEITDHNNNIVSNFNGLLYVSIYDKPSTKKTLGNRNSTHDYYNPVFEFQTQNNIIFKGKIEVQNGKFHFSFITPKDIAYNYDFGKISYYAHNDSIDAAGSFTDIVVGGFSDQEFGTITPPVISMFLNDENFISGNITDENPVLFANIYDDYGINVSGIGIGHDIVATLDNNTQQPFLLNDYFSYNLGSNNEGTLEFPFFNLSNGKHFIDLKVWNVFNLSSSSRIYFTVENSSETKIGQLYNYPNPAHDYTNFYYTHNRPKEMDKV